MEEQNSGMFILAMFYISKVRKKTHACVFLNFTAKVNVRKLFTSNHAI